MSRPVVAFLCVHNSCRSQMAEALAKRFASDVFEAVSAGTELKDRINPDAVATIQRLYGIDMTLTQRPKLLDALPRRVDVLVTMGCNVVCPYLPSRHTEDWGLDDPTGQPAETFEATARTIEAMVKDLAARLPGLLGTDGGSGPLHAPTLGRKD
jgi:arsenate reductase (thioredoxin)